MAKTVVGTVVAGRSQHIFLYNGHGALGTQDRCLSTQCADSIFSLRYLFGVFVSLLFIPCGYSVPSPPDTGENTERAMNSTAQTDFWGRVPVFLWIETQRDNVSRHESGTVTEGRSRWAFLFIYYFISYFPHFNFLLFAQHPATGGTNISDAVFTTPLADIT
ncbi:hypothetical protein F5Y03DRAFT_213041 [Xylaria venustula]|nr:hypothetical protein F5Y03DRAFT_213041 [Xylaria venustula]